MTNPRKRFMMDIETVGLDTDAAVYEIAWMNIDTGFFYNAYVKAMENAGRKFDEETIAWHGQRQNNESWKAWSGGHLEELGLCCTREEIIERMRDSGIDKDCDVWFKGADFDAAILGSFFGKKNIPWHYRNQGCMRTCRMILRDRLNIDVDSLIEPPDRTKLHEAAYDVFYQTRQLLAYEQALVNYKIRPLE